MMKNIDQDKTEKIIPSTPPLSSETTCKDSTPAPADIFANLEATLDEVAESNPRISEETSRDSKGNTDLRALLEVSLAVNSSLVLDDVLRMVMHKAIELMQAERGLIMLLNEAGELQVKSAYNLCREEMMEEDFRISSSITSEVARTGKPIYASDAMADDRYAHYKSVMELHLRSIMCVPLIVKEKVIGVIYLDNSSQTRMFLKSDLYLFQLYAQLVSNALHNANIYDSLLRMERYHVSVVNNSPIGIIVIDLQGRISTINPAALEIFDFDRANVKTINKSDNPSLFLECLPEPEQPRWHAMINTVLTTKHELSDPRYYHNTGYLEKVLSIKLTPLSGLPDGSDGLTMAVEDVTEKTTMEQYVILSEKLVARGEMAASVAHELNNYLSIISNNAELLALNIERNKYGKAKLSSQAITENIVKIKRFVDSLMDFSRPEPEYISYDLKTLIDDVLFSLRIQPRFKLIHFTIDLAEDVPNTEIDVGQIQQVLMNLLINAADAIGEQAASLQYAGKAYEGRIGIKTSFTKQSDTITIEVSDNGTGIPPEAQEKVFNLHFSTKKGGHGLGLHNCRKVMEQHGGTIEVRSQVNEGTVFTVTLPRLQPKVPEQDKCCRP